MEVGVEGVQEEKRAETKSHSEQQLEEQEVNGEEVHMNIENVASCGTEASSDGYSYMALYRVELVGDCNRSFHLF